MTDINYFITIDIGTQGSKVALCSEHGEIINSGFSASEFIFKSDGTIQQDPEALYHAVASTVKSVLASAQIPPDRILAVGIDGMMAGILGIDENWNSVFPYDSGLDKRCEDAIVKMQALGEDRVIRLSGAPIIVAQGAKIYWWQEHYPELCERQVKKYIPISTYVIGRMGGLKASDAFMDYTHIHLTSMADVQKTEWSDELLALFGVKKEKMPRICAPWEVVARVTPECARQTGIASGTPIVAGCGDTAASTFGAGVVTPGAALDVAGTASVFAACVDKYVPDTQNKMIIYQKAVMPGQWNPFGFVLGGQCLQWYKDQLDTGSPELWSTLNREARSAVNEGLYFIPFFAGRICPSEPKFAGSWMGLQFNHTRGNMFRSIMEAVAFEYKCYFDRVSALVSDTPFTQITGIGGGTNSRLFSQIKCNMLDMPYEIRTDKHTTLLAMMVISGYGIGYFPDLAEAVQSMPVNGQWLAPDSDAHKTLHTHYERYQSLIGSLRTIYEESVPEV